MKHFSMRFTLPHILFLLMPLMAFSSDESVELKIISKVLELPFRAVPDFLVYQKVSKTNSISYIHPKTLVALFFQNSTQDEMKSVIILEKGQDRLIPYDNKSVYVVLRKSPVKSMYWVLLAYIRTESNETFVELDSWNDRCHSAHYNKATLFGWTTCRSSNIVPCKSHSFPDKSKPVNFLDYKKSRDLLEKAPLPLLAGKIQLLEYFSDLLPFDSSGTTAELMGKITHALVAARSMHARLITRYETIRPSSTNLETSPVVCEESNDLDTNGACAENLNKFLQNKTALNYTEALLDSLVNDIGALVLNSNVVNLLNEGVSLQEINHVGQEFLQGLVDKQSPPGFSENVHKELAELNNNKDGLRLLGIKDGVVDFFFERNRKKRSRGSKVSEDKIRAPQWVLETDTDLFSTVAWTTNKFSGDPNSDELASDKSIKTRFKGIGGCGFRGVHFDELKQLTSTEEVVEFHMKALGTFCLPSMKHQIMDLVEKKISTITANLFQTNVTSRLKNKRKLNYLEMEELSRSLELWAYSRNLQIFFTIRPELIPKYGRFQFIKMFTFDYLSTVNTYFPNHSIKLRRNFLRTLQSLFAKSLQNIYRAVYEFCESCTDRDREIQIEDATIESKHFLGLIVFIASRDLQSQSIAELYWAHLNWLNQHEQDINQISRPFTSSLERKRFGSIVVEEL